MTNKQNVSFHESTVVKFTQEDHKITIDLEDVNINGQKGNGKIICYNVALIKIDGALEEAIEMPTDDGEVLTLETNDIDNLYIIIEWNDFIRHTSFTKSYLIECENIEISY